MKSAEAKVDEAQTASADATKRKRENIDVPSSKSCGLSAQKSAGRTKNHAKLALNN